MISRPLVTDLRFYPGGWRDLASGLVGYVVFRVAGVVEVDGVTVRETLDGRTVISWPMRRDGSGQGHYIVRPVDAATRRAIEQELLAQLDDLVPGGAS